MNMKDSIIDITDESELAVTLLRIRGSIQTNAAPTLITNAKPLQHATVSPKVTKHPVALKKVNASTPMKAVLVQHRHSKVEKQVSTYYSLPPPIVCETKSSPKAVAVHSSADVPLSSNSDKGTTGSFNSHDIEERDYAESNSYDSYDEDHGDYNVRRDIIEAALLSQPQRGRKRDNLSVVERLELTRTRNREHAKSTRIRKKLRHQELVDKEVQLRSVTKREELNRRQCQRVLEYVHFRQASLQSELASIAVHHGSEGIVQNQTTLASLVTNDFRFESNEVVGSSTRVTTAVISMNQFGRVVADIVRNKCGSSCSIVLSSSSGMSLLEDDIAISRNGVTMIQLSLAAVNEQHLTKVATVWMRFEFETNSNRIKLLVENVSTDTVYSEVRGANLESQTSHPSVVSLDTNHDGQQISSEGTV